MKSSLDAKGTKLNLVGRRKSDYFGSYIPSYQPKTEKIEDYSELPWT